MALPIFQNFLRQRKATCVVVAVLIAGLTGSYYWKERKEWLAQITLEVQASSAPGMGRTTPTRAALLLQSASNEKVLQAKDWTGATAKPLSRLRFDIPHSRYRQIIFYPDPALEEVDILQARLIPHSGNNSIEAPLDRLKTLTDSISSTRSADSIHFRRSSGAKVMPIALEIGDLLEDVALPEPPGLGESALVFLGALVAAYFCLVALTDRLATPPESPSNQQPQQIPWLRFGIMFGLVACMAAAAPFNAHPDEYLHVETAKFYIQHWLAPSLENESVVPTLSHYGFSYLSTTDLGYFFAGKFALFCHWLFPDVVTTLRFFNALLLIILSLSLARSFPRSSALWILSLTPQIWYTFAGYNTEGWACFVSFLLVAQIATERSSLQKGLAAKGFVGSRLSLLPTLVLACLVLLAKKNFVFVFLFFAVWLAWHWITRQELHDRRKLMRIVLLILIPLGVRFGMQLYLSAVNHSDLPRAIHEQAEKYAEPAYKPSASRPTEDESNSLRLKDRGVSLSDAMIKHQWLSRTVTSFFGTYGWMTISSPAWFYAVMAAGWVLFVGCTVAGTGIQQSGRDWIFYGIAWAFLPLIAMTAFYFSWTSDFQPQGRYLFPFLPILFYVVNAVRPASRKLLSAIAWTLFALSAYGFIFFGLRGLLIDRFLL